MESRGVRPWMLVTASVAALALAAGCGDTTDGDPDGATAPPTVEEAEREEDREDREARDERTEPTGERSRAVERVLDACREVARRVPRISEERRDKVIAECEEAAASDEEALRRATRAACDAFAAAAVPWPVRGPVAQACKRAIPDSSPF